LIENVVLKTSYAGFGRVSVGQDVVLLGGFSAPVRFAYFSDTIMLWTSAKATHVSPFLAKCADLICEGLRIGLPLRGAVCWGPAVMNKTTNTYIGATIIEANELEKGQRWIGATLGIGFKLDAMREALSESLVVPLFCGHLKTGTEFLHPYLTLDWVSRWPEKTAGDLLTTIESLRQQAPSDKRIYHDNTIDFVKCVSSDSLEFRRAFLRTTTYRVHALEKVDLAALKPQDLVALKVKGEPPQSGHLLGFPPDVLQRNRRLSRLVSKKILFVKRLDWAKFVANPPEGQGSSFRISDSGVVMMVNKEDVEYIDVFTVDGEEQRTERDPFNFVVIR